MKMRRLAKLRKRSCKPSDGFEEDIVRTLEQLQAPEYKRLARDAAEALGPVHFRKFGEKQSFVDAMGGMSDADLDRALAEGTLNGGGGN